MTSVSFGIELFPFASYTPAARVDKEGELTVRLHRHVVEAEMLEKMGRAAKAG
ncbi:hypothetical protein [Frigidibacter sp. SD6-1]|uniref:hypothetical protein n=1 Tax=Frigidibacter sp. SD6-1 TaxID=3032581 RepID=UPI0024DF618D|nr:hypothetical protein [Frigidibacter sp. SD6-1]